MSKMTHPVLMSVLAPMVVTPSMAGRIRPPKTSRGMETFPTVEGSSRFPVPNMMANSTTAPNALPTSENVCTLLKSTAAAPVVANCSDRLNTNEYGAAEHRLPQGFRDLSGVRNG